MGDQLKWHNTAEGPAPCHATVKTCQYGEIFTSELEASKRWDHEQQRTHNPLAGLSKKKPSSDHDSKAKLIAKQMSFMRAPESYEPNKNYFSNYPVSHVNATQSLALNQTPSALLYSPVIHIDERFQARSTTSVRRVELESGQWGYFKAFQENSHIEREIKSWGTSSLQSIANEVNAYRIAQVMGGDYKRLVPETVIREIDGKLGSLQEEVIESLVITPKFDESPSIAEDFRRAALFDFIIGNVDRHPQNYLIDEDEYGDQRIRLIDNAYGMSLKSTSTNVSLFNDNSNYLTEIDYTLPEESRALTKDDYDVLTRVSEAVHEWDRDGTITHEQAESLHDRITELRVGEEISPLKYYQGDH